MVKDLKYAQAKIILYTYFITIGKGGLEKGQTYPDLQILKCCISGRFPVPNKELFSTKVGFAGKTGDEWL